MNFLLNLFHFATETGKEIFLTLVVLQSGFFGGVGYTFGTCGNRGRLGPTQHQCDVAYQHDDRPQVVVLTRGDRNYGNGRLPAGVQVWTVPYTGMYT